MLPRRGCATPQHGRWYGTELRNPFGVDADLFIDPRVAPQPWAMLHDAFGVAQPSHTRVLGILG